MKSIETHARAFLTLNILSIGTVIVFTPKLHNFELLHTDLSVRFDIPKELLYGDASLTLRPYFYETNTLVVDAKGMKIHILKKFCGVF